MGKTYKDETLPQKQLPLEENACHFRSFSFQIDVHPMCCPRARGDILGGSRAPLVHPLLIYLSITAFLLFMRYIVDYPKFYLLSELIYKYPKNFGNSRFKINQEQWRIISKDEPRILLMVIVLFSYTKLSSSFVKHISYGL